MTNPLAKKDGKILSKKPLLGQLKSMIMENKIEVFLIVLAAFLLFPNLGDRTFGGDEPYGIEAAGNILRNGIPEWRSSDSLDYNRTFVYNSPPSEYIMAAFMYVFGFSELAARAPMAIFGFISIIAMYLFIRRVSGRKIALVSLVLIVFSAMFYLHARQARYYPMALLFNVIFLYSFNEYFILKRQKKWLFILSASLVLMFYTHIETAFYASIALAIWAVIKRKDLGFSKLIKPAIAVFLLLMPLAFLVMLSNTYNLTIAGAPPILQPGFIGIFAYYFFSGIFYFLVFFVPFLFLFIIPKSVKKINKSLLLFFALLVASNILVSSIIGPFGAPALRKLFVATFPLVVLLNASAIYFLWEKAKMLRPVAAAAVILLLFTNFLFLFPAAFFSDSLNSYKIETLPDSTKSVFIQQSLAPRFYFFDYLYEISHHYESSIEPTLKLLKNSSGGGNVLYPTRNNILTPYLDCMGKRIVYKLNNSEIRKYEWIIWEDRLDSISSYGINVNNYQALAYTAPSYVDNFWGDMPDLVNHLFRSDNVPRLNITMYRKIP